MELTNHTLLGKCVESTVWEMLLHGTHYSSWGKLDDIYWKATLLEYLRKTFFFVSNILTKNALHISKTIAEDWNDNLKLMS